MQVLFQGVSPPIEECTKDISRHETCFNSNIKTGSVEDRNFTSISNTFLRACNMILQELDRALIGYDLHIDFSKGSRTDILNSPFNERNVIGML